MVAARRRRPRDAPTCCGAWSRARCSRSRSLRLRVELRHQLDEVAASRARIVAAGDAERRRIERDLHDGAQQRLVSIGLALRHAQHELGPDAAAHGQTLEARWPRSRSRFGELRELARGLRRRSSTRASAALQELAGRAALPVAVDATAERFPDGVESAAYFIACEALTNATKHAHASRVSLSAQRRNGSLVVCVADDGVGGAAPGRGHRPERPAPTGSAPTAGRCGSRASAGPARA